MARLAQSVLFESILVSLFPREQHPALRRLLLQARTVDQFQQGIVRTIFEAIAARSMQGHTSSGLEHLSPQRPYLYLANHRDIVLDSVLLMFHLLGRGLDTAEITFGSNLMQSPDIIDFGRLNKMFTFMRSNGSSRELLAMSKQNSAYIHHAMADKGRSVWIAQRNGRTKDGNDRTDMGVLKMLTMSAPQADFVRSVLQLSIVPVCVSYEFEPCAFLKTREVYVARRQCYEKAPGEDLRSIVQGIIAPKGRVHLAVCPVVDRLQLERCAMPRANDSYRMLAQHIDSQIHAAYKLWPNNYIAHDWLHGTAVHVHRYTELQRANFEHYAKQGLASLEGDAHELLDILLGIYATPVDNALNANG